MDDLKSDGTNSPKKKRKKAKNKVSHLWEPTAGGWHDANSAIINDAVSNEQTKFKRKLRHIAKRKKKKCVENAPSKQKILIADENVAESITDYASKVQTLTQDDEKLNGVGQSKDEEVKIVMDNQTDNLSNFTIAEIAENGNENDENIEDSKTDGVENEEQTKMIEEDIKEDVEEKSEERVGIVTKKEENVLSKEEMNEEERDIIKEGNEYIKSLMKLKPELLNQISSGDINLKEANNRNEDDMEHEAESDSDGSDNKSEDYECNEDDHENGDDTMNENMEIKEQQKQEKNEEIKKMKMRPTEEMIESWCRMIPNEQLKTGQFTKQSGKKILNIRRCHHRLLVFCCITKYCEVDPIIRSDGSRYYKCNEKEQKLVKFYVDKSVKDLGVLHGDKSNKRSKKKGKRSKKKTQKRSKKKTQTRSKKKAKKTRMKKHRR